MDERRRGRASVPEAIRDAGGDRPGVAREVGRETGVPEAQVHGVATFFHLLAEPEVRLRICQGLSCQLRGAAELLAQAKAQGLPAAGCSCLAACDAPVAALRDRTPLVGLEAEGLAAAGAALEALRSAEPTPPARHADPSPTVFGLHQAPRPLGAAFAQALALGPERVFDAIAASGLQGRGGAGFPAGTKWRAVASQPEPVRYVVLNADEGEPGTFKDRELLVRRPDLVVEGLAIAASAVGARSIYCYLRGEFRAPWQALAAAVAEAERRACYPGLTFELHAGHGAYICGEETALLEALEGKRGMPRLKPPYPTERGLFGKPTLVHNVETIACVPAILERGPAWFSALGRTGAGTKLYCVSGHVAYPGVYELPLGVCLDELVAAAGGYVGELRAFSPGGASSGFLPAHERTRPLDFAALAQAGSMLGSAGVVVLNDTVDLVWAARQQLAFFEEESCGQCAPCRIGTRFLREAVDRFLEARTNDPPRARDALAQLGEVAWEMGEASICGLGQTAALPLTSILAHFPEELATP
ncbi:MAG: SLBB domain-containing protein [Deltaproteobacteria bacterium]|nr:SLBB domain-containing protein [Deltaproteobacteria bacterium]